MPLSKKGPCAFLVVHTEGDSPVGLSDGIQEGAGVNGRRTCGTGKCVGQKGRNRRDWGGFGCASC